jgi:hypothetical protein
MVAGALFGSIPALPQGDYVSPPPADWLYIATNARVEGAAACGVFGGIIAGVLVSIAAATRRKAADAPSGLPDIRD